MAPDAGRVDLGGCKRWHGWKLKKTQPRAPSCASVSNPGMETALQKLPAIQSVGKVV